MRARLCRRLCQLTIAGVLFICCVAWLLDLLHGAQTVVEMKSVNSESESRVGNYHFVTLHGLKATEHGKLREKNYVNSVHFNVSNSRDQRSVGNDFSALCDEECAQFRKILLNWPPDKPKAAIYYLAKADRLSQLRSSLMSVYHSFLRRFDYPVIVFHEADARDLLHWNFRRQFNIQLFFQEVKFSLPEHVNSSAVKFDIKCASRVGYRHMCRFHAKQVYEQAVLVGLEYVWRLDDDSRLPKTIYYDPFHFMSRKRLQYGYVKIHVDSYDCTTGLWNAVKHYMKMKHLKAQYFENWTEPNIFYNNFEISAVALWMSDEYKGYINFIDLLGGIYYYRWGDAPIKSIAVTLFLPENATHLFTDITYQHGNFYTNGSYSSF